MRNKMRTTKYFMHFSVAVGKQQFELIVVIIFETLFVS